MSNLEYLKKAVSGMLREFEKSPFAFPPPIAKTLGFSLVGVDEGRADVEIDARTVVHSNPVGTIHGGILCDVADAAIGVAHMTTLKEGETFTSIDLQINFFRPVWNERLNSFGVPSESCKNDFSVCLRYQEGRRKTRCASDEHGHDTAR